MQSTRTDAKSVSSHGRAASFSRGVGTAHWRSEQMRVDQSRLRCTPACAARWSRVRRLRRVGHVGSSSLGPSPAVKPRACALVNAPQTLRQYSTRAASVGAACRRTVPMQPPWAPHASLFGARCGQSAFHFSDRGEWRCDKLQIGRYVSLLVRPPRSGRRIAAYNCVVRTLPPVWKLPCC
jgi:hypothetical protein